MKSKIFSLFIATLILWGSTTEPMGRFFRYKSPAVAKWANRAQWGTLVGWSAYNLKRFNDLEDEDDRLPDIDNFKENYLRYREKNPNRKGLISDSDLDKMNASYARKIINDDAVKVKYDPYREDPASFNNYFTGKKYIVLPANARNLDGTLHHEYAHIAGNHNIKSYLFGVVACPLAALGIFKTTLYGYKIMRYGYAASKNHIPSIGASLLKIPGTLLTYVAAAFPAHYQSRLHEYEADDAIPAELAYETADYYQEKQQDSKSKPVWLAKLLATHPFKEDRIERLRARAAQTKS